MFAAKYLIKLYLRNLGIISYSKVYDLKSAMLPRGARPALTASKKEIHESVYKWVSGDDNIDDLSKSVSLAVRE